MKNQVIGIVVGQSGYNDIGLIRSCGEAGMNVIMIAAERFVVPIHKSRYVCKWIKGDIDNSDNLVKIINGIAKDYPDKKLVLFPASDMASCLMDECQESLSKVALVPGAKGNLKRLMNKAEMVAIAESVGMNVPCSQHIVLEKNKVFDIKYPCIIKPLRSIGGEKSDISVCLNDEEFIAVSDIYMTKGHFDVLVQDYINSKGSEEIAVTGVVLPDGRVETHGLIHKKRIRGNGSTVFATFLPQINSLLQSQVIKFMRATKYVGIFDMEFICNSSDTYFIECNFRNGAYGYAITSAGFNMPDFFFRGMTNQDTPQISTQKVTFMEERSDILNVLEHNISVISWLRDVLKTDTFLWWNRKDMKPMYYHFKSKLLKRQ